MKSEEQPGTRSERTCRPRDVCWGATETIQQGLMHPDCASENPLDAMWRTETEGDQQTTAAVPLREYGDNDNSGRDAFDRK